MNILSEYIRHLMISQKHSKLRRKIARFRAGVVVFVTTYSLILPAMTIEYDTALETPGISFEEGELISDISSDPADEFFGDESQLEEGHDEGDNILVTDPEGNINQLFTDDSWIFEDELSDGESDHAADVEDISFEDNRQYTLETHADGMTIRVTSETGYSNEAVLFALPVNWEEAAAYEDADRKSVV